MRFKNIGLCFAVALAACATVYYTGPESDHFGGREFFNLGKPMTRSLGDFLTWQRTREQGFWPDWIDNENEDGPPEKVNGTRWRVSFIGHATVLLQTAGLSILTDPK